MTLALSPIVAPSTPNATFPIQSLLNRLQDFCFDTLARLLYSRERLMRAADYDDKETQLEQVAFARIAQCHDCSRHALPLLLKADSYDHEERYDGHAVVLVDLDAMSTAIRQGSTDVERGRLAVIGSKQAKLRMVES